jgi:hypothetical protein
MSGNYTQLIETWRMQWVLLQLAVQLDQRWLPSFQPQSQDAVKEIFSIAKKLGGVTRELATLGELRKHLLEQIIETGSTLANSLSVETTRGDARASERQNAEDILFVARTLDRCVGMRSGDLTVNSAAQRLLWSSITSTRSDQSEAPRRGPELIRHTCTLALTRLDDWLDRQRTNADRAPCRSSPLQSQG